MSANDFQCCSYKALLSHKHTCTHVHTQQCIRRTHVHTQQCIRRTHVHTQQCIRRTHVHTQQCIRCVYYLSHCTLCKHTRSTAMQCHLLKRVATSVLACLTCSYTAGESWVIQNTCNDGGSQLVQERAAVTKEEEVSWGRDKSSITIDTLTYATARGRIPISVA